MKLEYIIKSLIQNNKIKTQLELTDILAKKGFSTTQSNISRILKKLNTVKIVDENKDTYYVIHNRPLEVVNWTKNLIVSIESNGQLVVIETYCGSANLIAPIWDVSNIDNLMATVAGDNTIICVPEDIKQIDTLVAKLKSLFMLDDIK